MDHSQRISPEGDDKIRFEMDYFFQIRIDQPADSVFGLSLWGVIAVACYTGDLFIQAQCEKDFGDVGSEGNDPLGRISQDMCLTQGVRYFLILAGWKDEMKAG
jgi:hypothetical protein